jgi:hypothetical protein
MPFEPFYVKFHDLAIRETRSITIFEGHPTLPADEYGLVESYCNDENCDCRRVIFNVLSKNRNDYVAVIGYGWESADFYRQWTSRKDLEVVRELQGPVLNPLSPQSELAPALLELMDELVLKDSLYVDRLKRHYQMFKEKVDPKYFGKSSAAKRSAIAKQKSQKRKRH